MQASEPEVGGIYLVEFDDCCFKGYFVSRVDSFTSVEIEFSNGVVLTEWGQVSWKDVANSDSVRESPS